MKRSLQLLTACALALLAGCDTLSSPPRRACSRVAKLCELDEAQISSCEGEVTRASAALGKEHVDRLIACVQQSKGCAEASGCLAGAGLGALTDQIGDFLKGLGRELK